MSCSHDCAQKQFTYFRKLLSIFDWLSDKNPENDTGLSGGKMGCLERSYFVPLLDLERSHRGHQMFSVFSNIAMCDLMSCVRPLVFHVQPIVTTMWTQIFSLSSLSSIDFQCYDHWCMLRPLSCLTMFCDHNISLIFRFNLQYPQKYII